MKNKTGGYLGGADGKAVSYRFRREGAAIIDFSGPCRPYDREERPRTDPRAPAGAEKSIVSIAGSEERQKYALLRGRRTKEVKKLVRTENLFRYSIL